MDPACPVCGKFKECAIRKRGSWPSFCTEFDSRESDLPNLENSGALEAGHHWKDLVVYELLSSSYYGSCR